MISEVLFALCPILKAIADTVDHHYDTSVFYGKNPKFWDRDVSETEAKRVFGYKFDAWHLSLSAMIVCFILALALREPKLAWYYELVIAGTYWNLMFNLWYNKILR